MHRLPGVSAAVFPDDPERRVYNNAVLDRDLAPAERERRSGRHGGGVLGGRRRPLRSLGARERPGDARRPRAARLRFRGVDARNGHDPRRRPPPTTGGRAGPFGLGRSTGASSDCRRPAGRDESSAFHLLVARLDGESVATAIALDHEGDCGIYNVGTSEHARRRGLASALTALHLHEALARGCRTASVQSTPMAEHVYAAVGFRRPRADPRVRARRVAARSHGCRRDLRGVRSRGAHGTALVRGTRGARPCQPARHDVGVWAVKEIELFVPTIDEADANADLQESMLERRSESARVPVARSRATACSATCASTNGWT